MKINDGKSIKVPLNTFPCRGRGQVLAFLSLLFSPSSPFAPLSFFFPLQLSLWPATSWSARYQGARLSSPLFATPASPTTGIFYFAFSARSSSSISLAFTLAWSNTRGTHTFAPFCDEETHTPLLFRPIFEREFSSPPSISSTTLVAKLLTETSARMINRRRVSKGWKTVYFRELISRKWM